MRYTLRYIYIINNHKMSNFSFFRKNYYIERVWNVWNIRIILYLSLILIYYLLLPAGMNTFDLLRLFMVQYQDDHLLEEEGLRTVWVNMDREWGRGVVSVCGVYTVRCRVCCPLYTGHRISTQWCLVKVTQYSDPSCTAACCTSDINIQGQEVTQWGTWFADQAALGSKITFREVLEGSTCLESGDQS